MQPLVTTQQVLTWVCLLPADDSLNNWNKRAYVIVFLIIIGSLVGGSLGGLIFVWTNKSIDLKRSLYELTIVILYVDLLYTFLVLFLGYKTQAMFEQLSNIYKRSNFPFWRQLDVTVGFFI